MSQLESDKAETCKLGIKPRNYTLKISTVMQPAPKNSKLIIPCFETVNFWLSPGLCSRNKYFRQACIPWNSTASFISLVHTGNDFSNGLLPVKVCLQQGIALLYENEPDDVVWCRVGVYVVWGLFRSPAAVVGARLNCSRWLICDHRAGSNKPDWTPWYQGVFRVC